MIVRRSLNIFTEITFDFIRLSRYSSFQFYHSGGGGEGEREREDPPVFPPSFFTIPNGFTRKGETFSVSSKAMKKPSIELKPFPTQPRANKL